MHKTCTQSHITKPTHTNAHYKNHNTQTHILQKPNIPKSAHYITQTYTQLHNTKHIFTHTHYITQTQTQPHIQTHSYTKIHIENPQHTHPSILQNPNIHTIKNKLKTHILTNTHNKTHPYKQTQIKKQTYTHKHTLNKIHTRKTHYKKIYIPHKFKTHNTQANTHGKSHTYKYPHISISTTNTQKLTQ